MKKEKGVVIADHNTRSEDHDEDDDLSNRVDVPPPAVKISIPKASSKYDFVKVTLLRHSQFIYLFRIRPNQLTHDAKHNNSIVECIHDSLHSVIKLHNKHLCLISRARLELDQASQAQQWLIQCACFWFFVFGFC